MRKLSVAQRKVVAEFSSQIGVVWFAGGVVGPFFLETKDFSEKTLSFAIGLFFSLISLWFALNLVRGVES